MLDSVIGLLGFPEGYEFLAVWVTALIVCFVFINLLSVIVGILKSVGGFK